jgi:hypothetical protein
MSRVSGQTKIKDNLRSKGLLPLGVIRRVLDRHLGSKSAVAKRVKSDWQVARGLSEKQHPVKSQSVSVWLAGRITSYPIHLAADAVARELLEKEKLEKSNRTMKAGAA